MILRTEIASCLSPREMSPGDVRYCKILPCVLCVHIFVIINYIALGAPPLVASAALEYNRGARVLPCDL